MKKEEVIKNINPIFLNGIAHRGLHNDEYTENGLKAFENAIKNNVAFEYDVHLTKDHKLIVCHDSNLARTTGKDGIIEELTVKEIQDNYHLLDGGIVPTLDDVFELNKDEVPMVIELKTFKKNYKELALVYREYVKKIKDKKNVMLISFDARVLWKLKDLHIMRSLLIWKKRFFMWAVRNSFESLDLDKDIMNKKKVQRYSKNHFINVWTIEDINELKELSPYIDTATFQYLPVEDVKRVLVNVNN